MRLGFVMIEVRKRRGQPNDSNIIRITCAEWRDWLKKSPKRDGVQMPEPHGKHIDSIERKRASKSKPTGNPCVTGTAQGEYNKLSLCNTRKALA
jgi:hypothetical protein